MMCRLSSFSRWVVVNCKAKGHSRWCTVRPGLVSGLLSALRQKAMMDDAQFTQV